ncbi:MAG: hypothetical protein CM1200mP29_17740 [Verrucomicrobiota bacterium]|nr:MAG: hypothetical protein CM1200mP29_17740 [Verrucomicrobiota bacterium]
MTCAKEGPKNFRRRELPIKVKDSDLSAHIWRFLYDVARQYRESIDVYGAKRALSGPSWGENPASCSPKTPGKAEFPRKGWNPRLRPPLPEPIQKFYPIHRGRRSSVLRAGRRPRRQPPHMVNKFPLSALVEDRDPGPQAKTSANWTCVGICAHQSTEQGGARVDLPAFTL